MSPRTPKAVRQHQSRRRAELMVLQRAREYHTAVVGAELLRYAELCPRRRRRGRR